MANEPPLPSDYGFASRPDTFGPDHAAPPEERDYLNAGFYVFQPSSLLFEYYMGLFHIENRFNGGFPEQDLFNYAHRRSSNMPWRSLQWTWNVNHSTVRDYEAGVKSFHAKY
ncbi:glycosyltransferase [Diplogelasinospora grovesii]|uniref:Glycosyltransferase n=1 Tax=Diplogelasinospora grovesii TaxID=303347 RepID=A0AAN6NE84_9PEZI|nr:glycosyltransferase [Diplogelasinospora grovesii]